MASVERERSRRSRSIAAGLLSAVALLGPSAVGAVDLHASVAAPAPALSAAAGTAAAVAVTSAAAPARAAASLAQTAAAPPPAGLPVSFFAVAPAAPAPLTFLPRGSGAGSDPRLWGAFRNRRIKVIQYSAPLRVAQNDYRVNLEAPGAGRAIVSVELEF